MVRRPVLPVAMALVAAACSRAPDPALSRTELFRDAAAETGLVFRHDPCVSGKYYLPEIMGSGAALFDYDNDGDLDVFLIQDQPLDAATAAPAQPGNRLFRNELVPGGKLQFTDVTAASGLGASMYGMGAATGDFDNDGFTDLYVTAYGPNALYRNKGNGTFEDVTSASGAQDSRWSTSAAWVDYDRDGDLDLFFLNYVDFTTGNNKQCMTASGEPDYCTPKAYHPVPARLFRNDGGGRFADVTVASGIAAAYGPGLGAVVTDTNDDGWPDLYVANDTHANLLWVNQKNGTFREQALLTGAAYSEDGLAKAGMGVSAGDFDNDGDEDLFVANLTREGATLFVHDGAGGFQDQSLRFGLRPATFAFTGFGAGWIDYDNDGWLDIFIANGAVTRMETQRGRPWPFLQGNNLLRNGAGKGFTDAAAAGGGAIALEEASRGAAFGDVDNDGDVDILISNSNGPVRLLLNQAGRGNSWLSLTLAGQPWSRAKVIRKGAPPLWRRSRTDASYLSASDPRVHFGLGASTEIEAVEVEWSGGRRERYPAPEARSQVRLSPGQ
ncbi:MAG: CRTAC1 family protein [Bryobacteraceae bacterium]